MPVQTAAEIVDAIRTQHLSPSNVLPAIEAVLQLARRSLSEGDAAARPEYQRVMYYAHYDSDISTYGIRNYLAEIVNPIETSAIALVPMATALDKPAFDERLRALGGSRERIEHPMTTYLLSGNAHDEDVKLYLLHNWYRSRNFYRIIGDLSQRVGIEMASKFYSNLYEETGASGGPADAHMKLMEKLVTFMGLDASYDSVPDMIEALEYLNNRKRSVRAPHTAWGVAVVYAIESTAGGFATVQKMLAKYNVPKDYRQFYELHSEVDNDHEQQIRALATEAYTDVRSQQIIFTSIARHTALAKAYFDAIWREMQRRRARSS